MNWAHAGPIVEREHISLDWDHDAGQCYAQIGHVTESSPATRRRDAHLRRGAPAMSPKPKDLPPDVASGQVWRDADGQHYYVESVVREVATMQRCTAAGTVLNQRYRITRTGDQLREGFVLVKAVR